MPRCRLVSVLPRAVTCCHLQPGSWAREGCAWKGTRRGIPAVPAGLPEWAWELGSLASAPGSPPIASGSPPVKRDPCRIYPRTKLEACKAQGQRLFHGDDRTWSGSPGRW